MAILITEAAFTNDETKVDSTGPFQIADANAIHFSMGMIVSATFSESIKSIRQFKKDRRQAYRDGDKQLVADIEAASKFLDEGLSDPMFYNDINAAMA